MATLDKSLHLLLGLSEHMKAEDKTWNFIAQAVWAIYSAKVFLRRDYDAGRL